MKLLDLLSTYRVAAEVIVAGALLAAVGAQTWRLHSEQTAHAVDRAEFAEQRQRASDATAEAQRMARAEEQRRAAAQQEAADAAERNLAAARADAASAAAAAGRLSQRIAAAVADARAAAAHPAAAASSPAADDPIGVLADVLGRADARAGLLADLADQRGIAGATCERAYDSLTSTVIELPRGMLSAPGE